MSVIDELLLKDNYSKEVWLGRGLNPSDQNVILI